jgi:dihydrofolate reductase
MRKVIMWNMVTLDGMLEGSDRDISWFVFDDELEKYIHETQASADTLLFGRVTYEMMAGYWPTAEGWIADFMNSVPKFVFSRTLSKADWSNSTLIGKTRRRRSPGSSSSPARTSSCSAAPTSRRR